MKNIKRYVFQFVKIITIKILSSKNILLAKVIENKLENFKIEVFYHNGEKISKEISKEDDYLELNLESLEGPDDLLSLGDRNFNKQVLLYNIRKRFLDDKIYTFIGDLILVSVNPFKNIENYNNNIKNFYLNHFNNKKLNIKKENNNSVETKQIKENNINFENYSNSNEYKNNYLDNELKLLNRPPPHIYYMAEAAYQDMITLNTNQSIIISGEAGSGKTTAINLIIDYLVSRNPNKPEIIEIYENIYNDYTYQKFIPNKNPNEISQPNKMQKISETPSILQNENKSYTKYIQNKLQTPKNKNTKICFDFNNDINEDKNKNDFYTRNSCINIKNPKNIKSNYFKESEKKNHFKIQDMLLNAFHILESFGNAKSIKNENSSRFGKFAMLFFDSKGKIKSSLILNYLLESSRVTKQQNDERNFHIFYQLISGACEEERKKYYLKPIEKFYFLNQTTFIGNSLEKNFNNYEKLENRKSKINNSIRKSDLHNLNKSILENLNNNSHKNNFNYGNEKDNLNYEVDEVDKKNFLLLKINLFKLNFSESEVENIFKIISGILYLGNLYFDVKINKEIKLLNKLVNLNTDESDLILNDSYKNIESNNQVNQNFNVQNKFSITNKSIKNEFNLKNNIFFDENIINNKSNLENFDLNQFWDFEMIIPEESKHDLKISSELIGIEIKKLIFLLTESNKPYILEKLIKYFTCGTFTRKQYKEYILKLLNINRDDIVKTIYANLFNYIINKINSQLSNNQENLIEEILNENKDKTSRITDKDLIGKNNGKNNFIGILDFFGFENFELNGFEQLCINYTNERLLQFFNKQIFKSEQKDYIKEKIEWSNVDFNDNINIIKMIDDPNKSIFAFLEELGKEENLNIFNSNLKNSSNLYNNNNDISYQKKNFSSNNYLNVLSLNNLSLNNSLRNSFNIDEYTTNYTNNANQNSNLNNSALILNSTKISSIDMQFRKKVYDSFINTVYEKYLGDKINGFISINHYAGTVYYDIDGFIEKNNNSYNIINANNELLKEFRISKNDVFKFLFLRNDEEKTSLIKKKSDCEFINYRKNSFKDNILYLKSSSIKGKNIQENSNFNNMHSNLTNDHKSYDNISNDFLENISKVFKRKLDNLLELLECSKPRYIKCIRPSSEELENKFDSALVNEQLLSNGLLEALKIRNKGYSYRIRHNDFCERYSILLLFSNPENSLKEEINKINKKDPNYESSKTYNWATKISYNLSQQDNHYNKQCIYDTNPYSENIKLFEVNQDLSFTSKEIDQQINNLQNKLKINNINNDKFIKNRINNRFSLDLRIDLDKAKKDEMDKLNQKSSKRKKNLSSSNLADLNLNVDRIDFLSKEEIIEDFRNLTVKLIEELKSNDIDFSQLLLEKDNKLMQIGYSRVFMKEEIKNYLENKRKNIKLIINIQSHIRRLSFSKKFKFEKCANKIIKVFRLFKLRRQQQECKSNLNRNKEVFNQNEFNVEPDHNFFENLSREESSNLVNGNNGFNNMKNINNLNFKDNQKIENNQNRKRIRGKTLCSKSNKKNIVKRKSKIDDLFEENKYQENINNLIIKKFYLEQLEEEGLEEDLEKSKISINENFSNAYINKSIPLSSRIHKEKRNICNNSNYSSIKSLQDLELIKMLSNSEFSKKITEYENEISNLKSEIEDLKNENKNSKNLLENANLKINLLEEREKIENMNFTNLNLNTSNFQLNNSTNNNLENINFGMGNENKSNLNISICFEDNVYRNEKGLYFENFRNEDELNEKIKSLQLENSNLQKNMQDLNQTNEMNKHQIKELKKLNEDFKSLKNDAPSLTKNSKYLDEIKELYNKITYLEKENINLKSKLKTIEIKKEVNLSGRNNLNISIYSEKGQEHNNENFKMSSRTDRKNSYNSKENELVEKLEKYRKDNKSLKKKLYELKIRFENSNDLLQNDINQKNLKIETLIHKNSKLELNNESLLLKVANLEKENSEFKNNQLIRDSSIEELKELKILNNEIDIKLKQKALIIQELKDQVENYEQEIRKTKNMENALKEELLKRDSEINKKNEYIQTLQIKISDLNDEFLNLKKNNLILKSENEFMEDIKKKYISNKCEDKASCFDEKSLLTDINNYKNKIIDLEASIKIIDQGRDHYFKLNLEFQSKINNLEKECNKKSLNINNFEKKLEKKKKVISIKKQVNLILVDLVKCKKNELQCIEALKILDTDKMRKTLDTIRKNEKKYLIK